MHQAVRLQNKHYSQNAMSTCNCNVLTTEILTSLSISSHHCMWCRQTLVQLLDGLASIVQNAASAEAAQHAACLVRMTTASAVTQARLQSEAQPAAFAQVVEDAGRQCAGLCIGAGCHEVHALSLHLATSDLFTPHATALPGGHAHLVHGYSGCFKSVLPHTPMP